jgi:hypothetical protein
MANYYAVPFPSFQPAMRNILSISQAPEAIVVTTFDGVTPGAHQYQTGLIVRLDIPYGLGMEQANQLTGAITVIDTTSFSIPIDTTRMDPFVAPAPQTNPPTLQQGWENQVAMVVPVGEVNSLLTESTQNVLPYPLHMIE